jgi:hypothetical protein
MGDGHPPVAVAPVRSIAASAEHGEPRLRPRRQWIALGRLICGRKSSLVLGENGGGLMFFHDAPAPESGLGYRRF